MSYDKKLVYHPNHYNRNGRKECWEEMKDLYNADAVVIFDCLNAYKYAYRNGEKAGNPSEQEIAKIKAYLNHAKRLDDENVLNSYAKFVLNKTLKELFDLWEK